MDLWTFLAAVVGLLLGHGLDIFFDRLYSDSSLRGPLYRCSSCRERLHPAYLLPLLGPAWSLGRCRDCGRWLPAHAFLLAPGAAALFAVAELVMDGFGEALLGGYFATVFLALTFTDLESRLIPDRVVFPSLLIAAAFSWAWEDTSVLDVFAGGGVALAVTTVMYAAGRGAFGFGDVKMSTLMGLAAGFPAVVVGVFTGVFAAGAFALPLVLLGVLQRRDYIAYGPFIAIGAVVALFWGQDIWDWYFDR